MARRNIVVSPSIQQYSFVPDGTIADAEETCRKYEEIIASTGGVDLTESTIAANSRFFVSKEDVLT